MTTRTIAQIEPQFLRLEAVYPNEKFATKEFTDLVKTHLIWPLASANVLRLRPTDMHPATVTWACALYQHGCEPGELGQIAAALSDNEECGIRPAHGVQALAQIRRARDVAVIQPDGSTAKARDARRRNRRFVQMCDHLHKLARNQNKQLFEEGKRRGEKFALRAHYALIAAAKQVAQDEQLSPEEREPIPNAEHVMTKLEKDGWHFQIWPDVLAEWRRRNPVMPKGGDR